MLPDRDGKAPCSHSLTCSSKPVRNSSTICHHRQLFSTTPGSLSPVIIIIIITIITIITIIIVITIIMTNIITITITIINTIAVTTIITNTVIILL